MSKTILKAVARVQRLQRLAGSHSPPGHRALAADEPEDPEDTEAADDAENPKDEAQDLTDPDGNPVQTSPDMDPDGEIAEPDDEVDDEQFTLEDVIKCFLRANPTPTDEQVHAFAGLMDMSYEDFEAQVYKKFGEAVRQATSIGPSEELDETDENVEDGEGPDLDEEDRELEADDELDVQDEIEMFVVAYMLYNPEPTDEQIHTLAFVVDITKEELEARIYRMLGSFLKVDDESLDDDDEQDDDEDLDETDSDEKETDE